LISRISPLTKEEGKKKWEPGGLRGRKKFAFHELTFPSVRKGGKRKERGTSVPLRKKKRKEKRGENFIGFCF